MKETVSKILVVTLLLSNVLLVNIRPIDNQELSISTNASDDDPLRPSW